MYIVVSGAAGFIGSYLIGHLNRAGYENIIAVDDFSRADKEPNLADKRIAQKVERSAFADWCAAHKGKVSFIFHLGARTDTTEKNYAIFEELNLHYSQAVWNYCADNAIPLVYASSAATYGLGELGYDDTSTETIRQLKPLNPYGLSKQEFDCWALEQDKRPPFWAGLKFFNVYGPNEYHKGRMASVIFHAFRQLKDTGSIRLFRSHKTEYKDGEQLRDFIYVKDVAEVCLFLMQQKPLSGVYNLGTGHARSFKALAEATATAIGLQPHIEYIDIPEDIRETYQYFTEASMEKLRAAGYQKPFHSLEEGISDYVSNYLAQNYVVY